MVGVATAYGHEHAGPVSLPNDLVPPADSDLGWTCSLQPLHYIPIPLSKYQPSLPQREQQSSHTHFTEFVGSEAIKGKSGAQLIVFNVLFSICGSSFNPTRRESICIGLDFSRSFRTSLPTPSCEREVLDPATM